MWHDVLVQQVPILEKVLRTALVYLLLVALVRVAGNAGWPPRTRWTSPW